MTAAITAWLILTFILGLLAVLAIWARRPSRARGLSVAAFIVASPIAATALGSALGWPVPLIGGFNAPAGDYMVLGAKMVVGKGIFVLVDTGTAEPRYYRLPWSREMAEQLQSAMNEAGKDGGVEMTIPPFDKSWDENPTFNALPQPRVLPEKPRQENPLNYERSA